MKHDPWPQLSYEKFKSTAHLLHMTTQAVGKLKLNSPFEPHWGNVALWLTSRGLTTGLIPYQAGMFQIDIDLKEHKIIGSTTWGMVADMKLETMSVATSVEKLFSLLKQLQVNLTINLKPQEIPSPVAFNQDTEIQTYQPELANAWWQILISSYQVMQQYHAKFDGETPPIGLMWGTFDLRDARYNGNKVTPTGINAGYIRRNAMDEAQIEVGWWHGNEMYPKPAYYSFTYPQPDNIEKATVLPKSARWENALGEFVLDYDAIRQSSNPEQDLLAFFESTYQAGSKLAKWKADLIVEGCAK